MKIELISKDEKRGIAKLLIKDTADFFVNTIRRLIIEEVPTLAIEDVEFKDNSSALYDEVIALRLGLIPIKTDLKSYNLPSECKCKGEGCSMCQLKLTLQTEAAGIVESGLLKSKDPKCKVVFDSMPITKLLKGQVLELTATAVLGKGKEHIKWCPAYAYYRGAPQLAVTDKAKAKEAFAKLSGIIKDSSNGPAVTDLAKWNEAHEQLCEENGISVNNSETDFIFTVESFGQLDVDEIISEAVVQLTKKLDDFKKQLD